MAHLEITGVAKLIKELEAEKQVLSGSRDRLRALTDEIEGFEDLSLDAAVSLQDAIDRLSEQL